VSGPHRPAAAHYHHDKEPIWRAFWVINSTTRPGRFSAKAASWVVERLGERPPFEVELLDLRDYPLPFFDQSPPAYYKRDYPTEEIARCARKIDAADGYGVAAQADPAIQHDDPHGAELFVSLEPSLATLADDLIWWSTHLAAARAATEADQAA
jgi:hypothetical protein